MGKESTRRKIVQTNLYLMLGFPGSGKTTVAGIISKLTRAIHLWADKERVARFEKPVHSHDESIELYDALNQEVDHFLAAGQSVVYDTNFNFYKDREKLRDIASKNDAECIIVWVQAPRVVAKERATKDADKQPTRLLGNFSDEDFERMSDNLEPPKENEKFIVIDGTKVSREYVQQCLDTA